MCGCSYRTLSRRLIARVRAVTFDQPRFPDGLPTRAVASVAEEQNVLHDNYLSNSFMCVVLIDAHSKVPFQPTHLRRLFLRSLNESLSSLLASHSQNKSQTERLPPSTLLLQYTVVAFDAPLRPPAKVFADSITARLAVIVGGWLATDRRYRCPKWRCSLADLGFFIFTGLVYSISSPLCNEDHNTHQEKRTSPNTISRLRTFDASF